MLGRLMEKYPEAKVLRYPAIAEVDEGGRQAGEALFPQWKPLSFLHEQKRGMTTASWEALYQQRPIIVGGGELPIDKLTVIST
jgi:hypothetical protein